MTPEINSHSQTRSRAALAGAAVLGVCAIVCAAPIVLAALGIGAATAVVCNLYEAAAFGAVAVTAAGGAVLLSRRRIRSTENACACATATADSDDTDVAIACDLGVFTSEERAAHMERSQRVFSSIHDLREEVDGFAMSFQANPTLEKDVASWIEGERRCCPFFRFGVGRLASGDLSVRVTGPGGAKEILRAGLEEYGVLSSEGRRR